MKSSIAIRNALNNYKENELIFASKLYKEKLYEYINETNFYKMLERMCKNKELLKISKGIYYKPTITKYGMVSPTEKQIIETFTKNNTGMIIGYKMYNDLKLTTQVSKNIEILSSNLDNHLKRINHITIRKIELNYTNEESVK